MNEQQIKYSIQSALNSFSGNNLTEQSISLFTTLGYNTERQDPLLFQQKTYQEFKKNFGNDFKEKKFNEEKALTAHWKYADLLFQLTKDEVTAQEGLFSTRKVKWEGEDKETVIETYLFFTIELNNNDYPRGTLAQITREINKIFPMPVMLLFKYGGHLTLSIINRRLHKRDSQKDVLEKVTLIKDISISSPHRAHIEILFDLSFAELKRKYSLTNFVELHNAWQNTLDIKELNKRFYQELSNWYFWAIQKVSFPNDITDPDKANTTAYNSESVIRLITRLIFIWFIKEKRLIPDNIFDPKELPKLIKGFNEPGSTVYYRAILQNLFFATLNQKIEVRAFANDGGFLKHREDYGVKTLYRYADDFHLSKDEVVDLFKQVPFLNGGLFDCLDEANHDGKVMYFDGFSRNLKKQAQVPDELFFVPEQSVDLSDVYGNKKRKSEKVKGLINIFNNYKFTIAENTPIEEEVALDPELLGRVFENLLASYNPETQTTARKQTGSFYTPREIVNYMVDESLKAYLKQKLETEAAMSSEDAECGLEVLFEYNEKDSPFNSVETQVLVKAIDECKIIDPACGSGAFPMGILHKLVFILQKLDPKNELWQRVQTEKIIKEAEAVFELADKQEREERLIDINNTFDENINNPDYARKLFLIENCIYGVDIQPIATQISKLRFFISLVVDQKADIKKDNFGIRPLPNLELKFVSANTLIGIEKPAKQAILLENPTVVKLEKELQEIRHKSFSAKTATAKQRVRQKDRAIRDEMCNILEGSGWSNKSARQLSKWDPYDQNASSPFFDSEWMFGIKDGFDIVIGNPPYLREKGNAAFFKIVNESEFGKLYHQGKMDFWFYFLHKAIDITKKHSHISLITPRYWINSSGASKLIERIKNTLSIVSIVDIGKLNVFNEVAGQHMISLYSKDRDNRISIIKRLFNDINDINKTFETENLKIIYLSNNQLYSDDYQIKLSENKIEFKNCIPLGEIYDVSQGVVEAVDRISKKLLKSKKLDKSFQVGQGVFVLSKEELERLELNLEEDKIIKKYLEPTDVGKYRIVFNDTYLIYADRVTIPKIKNGYYPNIKKHLDKVKMFISSSNFPYGLHRPRKQKYFDSPKIIFKGMFSNCEFALDYENHYVGMSFSVIIRKNNKFSLEYLLAILNSKLALYWFYKNAKHRGSGVDVGVQKLRTFPVHFNSEAMSSSLIYEYIFIYSKVSINSFFYSLIDAMVFELYFPNEIKKAKAEVISHLIEIPSLKKDWNTDKKLTVIEEVHKELSNPTHPVSIAMERQKTIPEIRIIEGLPELPNSE